MLTAHLTPELWFSASPSTGTSTLGLYQRLLSLIHPFPHFQQCLLAHSCVSWILLLCLLDFSQLPKCPMGQFQPLSSLSSHPPLFYSQHSSCSLTLFFPQFSSEFFSAFCSQFQRTTLSSATSLFLSVFPQLWQGLLSLFFATEPLSSLDNILPTLVQHPRTKVPVLNTISENWK